MYDMIQITYLVRNRLYWCYRIVCSHGIPVDVISIVIKYEYKIHAVHFSIKHRKLFNHIQYFIEKEMMESKTKCLLILLMVAY